MRWKQFFTPAENMDVEEARGFIAEHAEGDYTLLDVRQPGEYEQARIPGGHLIPLPQLTDRLDEIDREKPVIVYWAVGGRSRVAAQMLSGQGFQKVYNLAGGIKAWQGATVSGPAEVGMGLISGNEKPEEMLGLIYGMEEGMRTFYEALAERVEDPDLASLCRKLSAVEVEHKRMLFDLYQKHGGEAGSMEALEEKISAEHTESGMTSEELLEAYHPKMSSASDVLILAMMLEAQALDLYLRYAHRSESEETTAVLQELADQEKAHLASLGELMDGAS